MIPTNYQGGKRSTHTIPISIPPWFPYNQQSGLCHGVLVSWKRMTELLIKAGIIPHIFQKQKNQKIILSRCSDGPDTSLPVKQVSENSVPTEPSLGNYQGLSALVQHAPAASGLYFCMMHWQNFSTLTAQDTQFLHYISLSFAEFVFLDCVSQTV